LPWGDAASSVNDDGVPASLLFFEVFFLLLIVETESKGVFQFEEGPLVGELNSGFT
jgi:hypothetical protein